MATGEYYLPATDVALPGVLPLQLNRIHKSHYRHGVWMGRSWSCTFDTRVVVTADAVTTIDADGAMLSFDPPAGDASVFARRGARWSLQSTPSGGYRLHTPDWTQTWHFEPKPQLDGADVAAGVIFVSALTDVHRNQVLFTYTDDGSPSGAVHSAGYRVGVDCRGGRIRSYTLATDTDSTVLRRFGYDNGDLTSVTDANGVTTRFVYDDRHQMVAWTDSIGATYTNTYDANGRVVSQGGAGGVWGGQFGYVPTDDGVTTTYTDAVGNSAVYEFDRGQRPVSVTNPAGQVSRTRFDGARNPVRVQDPTGAVTALSYTADGLPQQITDPLGQVTTMTYMDTAAGPKLSGTVDAAGAVTTFGYDAKGNRTWMRDANGWVWRWEYTATGAVAAGIDPLGRRTEYTVNAAGLPVAVVDPVGRETRLSYDVFGNVVAVVESDGSETRMAYDAERRMVSRTRADGRTEMWRYDGEGNRIAYVNSAGIETHWEYGFFDVPVARIDADGGRTMFGYDTARRLVTVTNPAGLIWNYRYHPDGTVAAQTDFNGATTTYTYDGAGRMRSRTNAAGQTVVFDYDSAGQVLSETSTGGDFAGERVSYTYDLAGRRTQVATPSATLSFAFDLAGQVTVEAVDGRAVLSDYNAARELIGITTPSGVYSAMSYDDTGVLEGVTTAGARCMVGRDDRGRPVRLQFDAAVVDSAWDASGRLVGRQVLGADPSGHARVLAASWFQYDANDSLSQVSAIDPVTPVLGTAATYGSDVTGRLVSRRTARGVERTSFDVSQNPSVSSEATDSGQVLGWQYRGTLLIDDDRSHYHYDPAGRVVQVVTKRLSRKPDVWHYGWDAWDRLRTVTTPDGRVHHYTYDPAGRRLSKQTDDSRIDFAWAGDRMVEQVTASTVTSWAYQPGQLSPYGQTLSAVGDSDDVDRQFFAIVTDQIDTPVALVDPHTGVIAGRAESTMWGATRWEGASTPWRYPGQYFDAETELHYNRHRYYHPGVGRYLTADPLGLAPSPNPYSYPTNPTTWADPLGLMPCGGREEGRPTSYSDRLGLHDKLTFDEATSVFNPAGTLRPEVINSSELIISGDKIGNVYVRAGLTSDGSNIIDWGKYESLTYKSPSGDFKVHYYYNPKIGAINYDFDYKVKYNGGLR